MTEPGTEREWLGHDDDLIGRIKAALGDPSLPTTDVVSEIELLATLRHDANDSVAPYRRALRDALRLNEDLKQLFESTRTENQRLTEERNESIAECESFAKSFKRACEERDELQARIDKVRHPESDDLACAQCRSGDYAHWKHQDQDAKAEKLRDKNERLIKRQDLLREENRKAIERHADIIREQKETIDRLTHQLGAVSDLPDEWEQAAPAAESGFRHALRWCAHQLRKSLGEDSEPLDILQPRVWHRGDPEPEVGTRVRDNGGLVWVRDRSQWFRVPRYSFPGDGVYWQFVLMDAPLTEVLDGDET